MPDEMYPTTTPYEAYRASLNDFEIKNAPTHLYCSGDFTLLTHGIRASIVGSRDASPDGLKRARLVATELVKQGVIIVSGLAKGIDTVAHQTAIELGGKTIAVLGTPLSKPYPKENKELLDEIKRNHLAISQFPEDGPVYQSNFPLRNKTMALISDATFIIEANEKSGTQHQAWEAIRLNRVVYILPNVIEKCLWAKKMLDYGAIRLEKSDLPYVAKNLPLYTSLLEFSSDLF